MLTVSVLSQIDQCFKIKSREKEELYKYYYQNEIDKKTSTSGIT